MKNSKLVEELVKIKIDIEQGKTFSAKSKIDILIESMCKSNSSTESEWKFNKHKDHCMIYMDPDYYGPCTCKNDSDDDL